MIFFVMFLSVLNRCPESDMVGCVNAFCNCIDKENITKEGEASGPCQDLFSSLSW